MLNFVGCLSQPARTSLSSKMTRAELSRQGRLSVSRPRGHAQGVTRRRQCDFHNRPTFSSAANKHKNSCYVFCLEHGLFRRVEIPDFQVVFFAAGSHEVRICRVLTHPIDISTTVNMQLQIEMLKVQQKCILETNSLECEIGIPGTLW